MQVTCDFQDRGCNTALTVEEYELHVKDCEFQPVQCRNKGCCMFLGKNDLDDHENEKCDFRVVGICKEGCGLTIINKDKDVHKCMEALKLCILDQKQTITAYESEIVTVTATFRQRERNLVNHISKLHRSVQNQAALFQKKLLSYHSKIADLAKKVSTASEVSILLI